MAAITSPKDAVSRSPGLKGYPVAASTTIQKGQMVCGNANGWAVPAANTVNYSVVLGVAYETVDNSAGGNGDKSVRLQSDRHFLFDATSITQAMVGTTMYVVNNGTFDNSAGANAIHAGVLSEFVSTTSGYIFIPSPGRAGPAAQIANGDLENGAVSTAKIDDGAVTNPKLDLVGELAYQARVTLTTAQVNAGAEVVAAPGAGYALRLIDLTVIAKGGTTAGATSLYFQGTKTGSVILVSMILANLARSAISKPFTASNVILADAASFVVMDEDTNFNAIKNGSDFTGATSFDFIVTYAVDEV